MNIYPSNGFKILHLSERYHQNSLAVLSATGKDGLSNIQRGT